MLFAIDGVFGLLVLGLWFYCIIDVITTDETLIRNLPKTVWLLVVLFLVDIGAIAWLIAGRPVGKSYRLEDNSHRARRSYGSVDRVGPATLGDRSLDNLSPIVREREERARLRVWEEQLRRREEELRHKELGEGS